MTLRRSILVLPFLSCVVQPAPVGPAPGAPPAVSTQTVQAGCTMAGSALGETAPGMAYLVNCPANCAAAARSVWGSGPYTADSALCTAAVHAGATSDATGGTFQVVFDSGQPAYRGSVQNNVNSSDYGSYNASYWIRMASGDAPAGGAPPPPGAPQVAQVGCSFTAKQLQNHAPGMNYRVECPSGCAAAGRSIWGTDVYTADSAVCTAAIHAGIITDGGGQLGVSIVPGQPAYRGTTRNGVRTSDYGAYNESFTVAP